MTGPRPDPTNPVRSSQSPSPGGPAQPRRGSGQGGSNSADDLPPDDTGAHLGVWLSAYMDGELPVDHWTQITRWISTDSEPCHLTQQWQQLDQLCEQTAPEEPSQAAWDRCQARICTDLGIPPPPGEQPKPDSSGDIPTTPPAPASGARANPANPLLRRVLALVPGILSAAAAILAVILIGHYAEKPVTRAPAEQDRMETSYFVTDIPFPVIAAHELTIISVDGVDVDALTVAEEPMLGKIELASRKDIRLLKVDTTSERDPPNRDLVPCKMEQGEVPVIVPALASARSP